MASEKKEASIVGNVFEGDVMGVHVKVYTDALDDFDLACRLAEIGEDSPAGMVLTVKTMFGDDWPRISDELRDGRGKLTMTKVGAFMSAVAAQVEALKNSGSSSES